MKQKKCIMTSRDFFQKEAVSMKLIDITNSHSQLVNADAATHRDIVMLNKKRRIKDVEIEFVVHRLFHMEPEGLDIIHADNFVEISIPVEKQRPSFN